MPRTHFATCVALTTLLLFPLTVAAQDRLASVTKKGDLLETLLFQEMNKHRAAAGAPALKLDDRISVLARDIVSKWTSGVIPATSEAIRGDRAAARAQILQKTFGAGTVIEENFQPTGTPESVAMQWTRSENERRRMLGDFSLAGIGIAADIDGNINYGVIFVRPGAADTPPAPDPSPSPSQIITFANSTAGIVSVFWLNNGAEEPAGKLNPGTRVASLLPGGQTYVVRDTAGKELKRFTVKQRETVTITEPTSPDPPPGPQGSLVGGKYTGMTIPQLEQEVVNEINKARQRAGLQSLRLDERISRIARKYSQFVGQSDAMLRQVTTRPGPKGPAEDPIGHWGLLDRGREIHAIFGSRTHVGENFNPTGSPDSVVNFSWTDSKGHRENMLHSAPTLVGVGIAASHNGEAFYTAIFVNPQHQDGIMTTPLTVQERDQLINQAVAEFQQARQGLTSIFRKDDRMTRGAQTWAEQIAGEKRPSRSSLGATSQGGPVDQTGYRARSYSEGSAIDATAKQAVETWTGPNAPVQIRNFTMNRAVPVEFGIGVARGSDGKLYWSLALGSQRQI